MEIRSHPVAVTAEPCPLALPREQVFVTDLMISLYGPDLFHSSVHPSARHGDGLYDSYMRTDHILKDDADTNSPSGLPPMPKHTVSTHTHTLSHVLSITPTLSDSVKASDFSKRTTRDHVSDID